MGAKGLRATRPLEPRPVDDIALGVVTLFAVALDLLLADRWWQAVLAVVGAALGIRWLWLGAMRPERSSTPPAGEVDGRPSSWRR